MSDRLVFPPWAFLNPARATQRVPVAISACLVGERVRYDGTDKRLGPGIGGMLASNLTLMPVCPEIGAGLGVPRPPVQLVLTDAGMRALGRDDPTLDVTSALSGFAASQAEQLATRNPPLCGYIWKSRSPSCGLGSTPLFGTAAARGSLRQIGTADGLQAAAVNRRLPWLVMEEETTLTEADAISRFVLACRIVAEVLDQSIELTSIGVHHAKVLVAAGATAGATPPMAPGDRWAYAKHIGSLLTSGALQLQ